MTPLREIAPERVAEAWNGSVPARYHLDGALIEQNLFDSELFHDEASLWHENAFVSVKRSAAPLYDGPDPKVAHLSLFNGGSLRLLERASAVLLGDGYDAVVVGTDSRHFLPGAPTDVRWMSEFLKRAGFARGGLAFDLEHDLRGYTSPSIAAGEYRRLNPDDLPRLDTFLQREFRGRWRYDVARKVERDGPETVFGLFLEGCCEGFALLQEEGCALPIGGAVWKRDLGPRWASLGPVGTSSHLRGQGYGHALLGAALTNLRDRGAAQTIIDWTALVDFYGAQGFKVTRTYRSYRLDLAAGRQPSARPRL